MDIERIQKSLVKKVKQAKKIREQLKEELKHNQNKEPNRAEKIKQDEERINIPKPDKNIVTVKQAQKAKILQEELEKLFKKEKLNERSGFQKREKEYSVITEALDKVTQAVNKTDEDIKKLKLAPLQKKQILPPLDLNQTIPTTSTSSVPIITEAGTPRISIKDITAPTPRRRPTLNEIIDEDIIGKLPFHYLQFMISKDKKDQLTRTDPVFGIYYRDFSLKIGKLAINFDNDHDPPYLFFVEEPDKRFEVTSGLMRLLTYREYISTDFYYKDDLKNYAKILFYTDTIFQENDKSTKKPKSSKGSKWIELVSHIWAYVKDCSPDIIDDCVEEFVNDFVSSKRRASTTLGSGLTVSRLKQYRENNIEYKYIDNLNELLKRLTYIASQEDAGNNNFHNEKLGVLYFINKEMEKVIDTPKGVEYLIRIISNLPKKVVKGEGLVNDLINKLPFELHWPGYNYLGPGTKLDERLARDDKPINKLDEAAKEHDIFYKHNKDTKTRHKADEVLEYKAWNRVLDPQASFGEKTAAWVTTTAMKAKRRFGMGLK